MKSPDDTSERFARLRRLHVEAYEADDHDTYSLTLRELTRELQAVRDFNAGLERMTETLHMMEGEMPVTLDKSDIADLAMRVAAHAKLLPKASQRADVARLIEVLRIAMVLGFPAEPITVGKDDEQ